MLSSVLRSARTVQVNIETMRAFVRIRQGTRKAARQAAKMWATRAASPTWMPGLRSCAPVASRSSCSSTRVKEFRAVMIEGPSREAIELVEFR